MSKRPTRRQRLAMQYMSSVINPIMFTRPRRNRKIRDVNAILFVFHFDISTENSQLAHHFELATITGCKYWLIDDLEFSASCVHNDTEGMTSGRGIVVFRKINMIASYVNHWDRKLDRRGKLTKYQGK